MRDSFLKKKLGLTQADDELDSAIQAIGGKMKDAHNKNRVTVYYLLADRFGKLSDFSEGRMVRVRPAASPQRMRNAGRARTPSRKS